VAAMSLKIFLEALKAWSYIRTEKPIRSKDPSETPFETRLKKFQTPVRLAPLAGKERNAQNKITSRLKKLKSS
jgi:hypothetical protein